MYGDTASQHMPGEQSFPSYRKHRAFGHAVVRLSGEDVYLGPYGTKTSHMAFD